MEDKDLKFTVIGAIVSLIGLAIVISTLFIDNPIKKGYLLLIAFAIFLFHRIHEFFSIKRTRTISGIMIVVLLLGIYYVLKYKLALV